MSHLLDQDEELLAAPPRELTLSTGSILGIFFGLALLCAVFFGFGYNIGHRSANAAMLPAHTESEASATPTGAASDAFSGFKPAAPGSGTKAAAGTPEPETVQADTNTSSTSAAPRTTEKASVTSPTGVRGETGSRLAATPPAATAPAATHAAAPLAASPAVGTPAGSFFVQVAAVSHPDDATLLLGALRSRGYSVAERTESTDKLIHLQIGPLSSKPQAEAMRQRLQADGYNAFIK